MNLRSMFASFLTILLVFSFIIGSSANIDADVYTITAAINIYDETGLKHTLDTFNYTANEYGYFGVGGLVLYKLDNFLFLLPHQGDRAIIRYDLTNIGSSETIPRIHSTFVHDDPLLGDENFEGIAWDPYVFENGTVGYFAYVLGPSLFYNLRDQEGNLLAKGKISTSLSTLVSSGGSVSLDDRYSFVQFSGGSGMIELVVFDKETLNSTSFIAQELNPYNPSRLFYYNNSLYGVTDDRYSNGLITLYHLRNETWEKIWDVDVIYDSNLEFYHYKDKFIVIDRYFDSPVATTPKVTVHEYSLSAQSSGSFQNLISTSYIYYNNTCKLDFSRYRQFSEESRDNADEYWRHFASFSEFENETYLIDLGYLIISKKNNEISVHELTKDINCNNYRLASEPLAPNLQAVIEVPWVKQNNTTSESLSYNFPMLIIAVSLLYSLVKRKNSK